MHFCFRQNFAPRLDRERAEMKNENALSFLFSSDRLDRPMVLENIEIENRNNIGLETVTTSTEMHP